MKRIALFILVFFYSLCYLHAQHFSLYQKRWLVQGADTLPYRVLLPLDFDSTKTYPVLFFLHGAGERGNDNEKQLTHGARLFVREDVRKAFPAIVIFPQCPRSSYWSNVLRLHDDANRRSFQFLADGDPTKAMALLQQLVMYTLQQYKPRKEEVFIGGLSMGAMGTYELVRRQPGVFRKAFAICGGADPSTAKKLRKTDWWIFHGLKDDVVDPRFSQRMAEALKQKRIPVRLTLYPDANHNSWDAAFAEPDLLPWLFSNGKHNK